MASATAIKPQSSAPTPRSQLRGLRLTLRAYLYIRQAAFNRILLGWPIQSALESGPLLGAELAQLCQLVLEDLGIHVQTSSRGVYSQLSLAIRNWDIAFLYPAFSPERLRARGHQAQRVRLALQVQASVVEGRCGAEASCLAGALGLTACQGVEPKG